MPLVAQDPSPLHSGAARTFQNVFVKRKKIQKCLFYFILFYAFGYFSNIFKKKNACFYQHKTACVKIWLTKFGSLLIQWKAQSMIFSGGKQLLLCILLVKQVGDNIPIVIETFLV